MSTFFGGDQLLTRKKVAININGSYTVPVGRYAKVVITRTVHTGNGIITIAGVVYETKDSPILGFKNNSYGFHSNSSSVYHVNFFELFTGDKVQLSNSVAAVIDVYEYALP